MNAVSNNRCPDLKLTHRPSIRATTSVAATQSLRSRWSTAMPAGDIGLPAPPRCRASLRPGSPTTRSIDRRCRPPTPGSPLKLTSKGAAAALMSGEPSGLDPQQNGRGPWRVSGPRRNACGKKSRERPRSSSRAPKPCVVTVMRGYRAKALQQAAAVAPAGRPHAREKTTWSCAPPAAGWSRAIFRRVGCLLGLALSLGCRPQAGLRWVRC